MRSKIALINIISSFGLQVVTIVCNFIVPGLIIGTFGSSVNGLVTSITQFLAYISLLESGFGPIVKSILYKPIANKNKEEIEEILKASERFFRIISYVFIVYILVLCFVMPMIVAKEFDFAFTLSLVLIISISTFAEYYFGMTYRLYLQAKQKTYIISLIQISTLILNTIIIVVLINCGASIQIVKLVSALIFVLRPMLQNIYVRKKYKIDLKHVKGNYKIKQKWDALAQHVASIIHGNTDITLLTLFTNTSEVSVYSVYYLVIAGVKKITTTLSGGIEATFGDMIAKNEQNQLNKSFKIYEILYHSIATIVFNCTLLLIIPFIQVYTKSFNDQNYIRPLFAIIFVLAEFVYMIRLPYITITYSAGHFKETRIGAWVEAIVNIVISLILVTQYGLTGIVIGTLISMIIRTIEFMYHSSKYILMRKITESFKWFIIIGVETLIIYFTGKFFVPENIITYTEFIKLGILIFIISTVITLFLNCLFFKNNIKEVKDLLKNILKLRKRQRIDMKNKISI